MIWRVRGHASFEALRRAHRVRRGPLTVAWVDDRPDLPPRLAFAISKKVGPAVTRNVIRRRLREVARRSTLAPGAWMVIVAPAAAQASFQSLADWWADAVRAVTAEPTR